MNNKKYILLIALLLFFIALSANLAMPLFSVYSKNENLGTGMAGLATAAYIAGLIPASLFLGGIAERLGNKRVLLGVLVLAILSVGSIAAFPNLYALIFARVIIGASVGIGIATGSAFLSKLFASRDEKNAASLVAFVSALGFGGGALSTSLFVAWRFSLRPPTFFIVLAALILLLIFAWRILPDDSDEGRNVKLMRLPLFPKGVGRFNLSIAIFWSVTGVIIGVLPSRLAELGFQEWSGLSLFLVNGTGALLLPLARRLSIDRALTLSYLLLPVGLTFLALGTIEEQLLWILIGCSIVGSVNYGFGYYATLNGAGELDQNRKARVIAGYLISAYIGFGGSALGVGFLADLFGLQRTLIAFLICTTTFSLGLLCIQGFRKKSKH